MDVAAVIRRVDHENQRRAFHSNLMEWVELVSDVFLAEQNGDPSAFFESLGKLGYHSLIAPLEFATAFSEKLHYIIGMSYGTVAIAHGLPMEKVAPPDDTPTKERGAYIRGLGDVRKMHQMDRHSLPLKGLKDMTKKRGVNFAFALYTSMMFAEHGGVAWSTAREISSGDGHLPWGPKYPFY